nr:myb-related protein 305-like [Ipomoea trifida]
MQPSSQSSRSDDDDILQLRRGPWTEEEDGLLIHYIALHGQGRWNLLAKSADNEIKNYWRTRVQKQAKHLNLDSNSAAFQQLIRNFWVPTLLHKIYGSIQPQNPQPLLTTTYEDNSSHQPLTNSNTTQSTYFSPLPPLHANAHSAYYGMEAFSPPLFTGPEDYFIDYDQVGEGNTSMDDFSVDSSLWSMDEIWVG